MIAQAWYPIHYFHLSFGKQDRLDQIAQELVATNWALYPDSSPSQIAVAVGEAAESKTPLARNISSLARYVPQRFLRAFFSEELRGTEDSKVDALIIALANDRFEEDQSPSLYRFLNHPVPAIEIHPAWYAYLTEHLFVLTGFCLWHLTNYLQKNNPNAPNIASKLFRPETRDMKSARRFWDCVFSVEQRIECIYSHQIMTSNTYSLDHFLPWSFVAHDMLWNILPTPREINSSKNNILPDMSLYFDDFAALQYKAVQIVTRLKRARLLEDYLLLLKYDTVESMVALGPLEFTQRLSDNVQPQVQIARNMGFQGNWRYLGQ